MNHVELDIEVEPLIPFREIIVALLADQGFESFVEYEKGVKAYTPTQDFDESAIRSLLADLDGCSTRYQHQEIPHVNWNAEWEKDYHPVEVTEDCVIRALFHEPMPEYAYELIIQPQMSFGTGHHPTTLLMLQMLLEMDLDGREVIDLGCGTGVLAILAEKKGAQKVLATDIEDFIVDNARSNVRHNACVNIRVDKADLTEMKPGEYGLILANINLNTLTQNLSVIRSLAAEGADIVLSGFYNTDAHGLIMQSESDGMRLVHKKTHDNWSALRFKYSASH